MPSSGFEVLLNPNNIRRLAIGLGATLEIALISAVISIGAGIFLGLLMSSENKIVRALSRVYLEAFRVVPIMVWLFLLFFGGAIAFGANMDGMTVSVAVFSMWGAAEMGDLVRGALGSIPRHQWQSAQALGLSEWQAYRFVIIPQAVRRLAPSAINLVTRMIKTTSLVVFVGVTEILRVGKQIIEFNMMRNPMASFWIYAFIFAVYFVICYPIAKFSRRLEKKWSY